MVVDANALLGLGAAAGMIVLLATVADYVLSSIGYSKIALRRNITANWLAWIPVVRYWTIGAISDNYDSRKDIKRRIRVFLVVTQVLNAAIIIPLSIYFLQLAPFIEKYGAELFTNDINGLLLLVPIVAAIAGLTILNTIFKVCYTVAVYKVFESTVPEKALVFTLLGAVIPLLNSIFVFISRNKGYDYVDAYYEDNKTEEEAKPEIEMPVYNVPVIEVPVPNAAVEEEKDSAESVEE